MTMSCRFDRKAGQGRRGVTIGVTRQALPTVTGFAVKCAIAALQTRNIAEGPLLHRAGLPEFGLGDCRHRVTAAAQGEFLETAAQALNDTAFGLHLAEQANPREAGLFVLRPGEVSGPPGGRTRGCTLDSAARVKPGHATSAARRGRPWNRRRCAPTATTARTDRRKCARRPS